MQSRPYGHPAGALLKRRHVPGFFCLFSGGFASPQILPPKIAPKELLPILFAVAIWGRHWSGRLVNCRCDNMAVVSVVNSGYYWDSDVSFPCPLNLVVEQRIHLSMGLCRLLCAAERVLDEGGAWKACHVLPWITAGPGPVFGGRHSAASDKYSALPDHHSFFQYIYRSSLSSYARVAIVYLHVAIIIFLASHGPWLIARTEQEHAVARDDRIE